MRLYLVRHAQTEWNAMERAQGHTDVELDATGKEQAEALGAAFRNIPVGHIWSSDLVRSAECARAVARETGARLTLDPKLRERGMGEWEGLFYPEFNAKFRGIAGNDDPHLLHARPPGGESLADVWKRLEPVVESLEAEEAPTLVVTHGGTCSLLLSRLLRANLATARSFRFVNCGITELGRRADGLFNLLRYNDVAHLAGAPYLSGNLDGVSR